MAVYTNIGWTNNTWNPWYGCIKVSQGCKFCYMYRDRIRYGANPSIITRSKTTFHDPIKKLKGPLVFTCSWSDFFITEADKWRGEAWDIIRQTPHLTYQILTKRPENILDRLPHNWGNGWDNVWLGVTVENNDCIWRLDALNSIPARVRFVSYEPALEYVNFKPYMNSINWLVSGGESGKSKRDVRMPNTDWFRQVRDDCARHNVPYFHKQNGGHRKIDGVYGGRMLDGLMYSDFPKIV